MTDQFLAEIRIFAGDFAPTGWALCNGQLIPLTQNTALFSLLGTTYGGDGRSNFALPNLMGSAPLQPGQGAALSLRDLGESGGQQQVALTAAELPVHSHGVQAVAANGNSSSPVGAAWAQATFGRGGTALYSTAAPNVSMSPAAIGTAGGGQPHNNMPPYLCLSFIIALQGIYPPRP